MLLTVLLIFTIILIQSLVRGYKIRNLLQNKCYNEEDFYTYDLLKDIPQK